MATQTMKGLWLENKILSYREDIPLPEIPEGELLVKVLRTGVCNTDIELIKGYYFYNGVIGHEFVGRVVDANAPEEMKGRRVVGEINCVCHKCEFCGRDLQRHCSNRTVMGIVNRSGTHAQYLTLPKENLLLVPDELSTEDLCFVEPLAAALEIQEQITFLTTDKVAVIGDGKLGLLIAKTIANTGCDLKVYGHHEEKLKILVTDQICTQSTPITKDELHTYDVVVECTGNEFAFQDAVSLLKPRGTLVMKSTHEGTTKINAAAIVVNELTLIGSRCGPFDKAIELIKSKKINFDGLLTKCFPLERGLEAFDYAKQKDILKVQLVMCDD